MIQIIFLALYCFGAPSQNIQRCAVRPTNIPTIAPTVITTTLVVSSTPSTSKIEPRVTTTATTNNLPVQTVLSQPTILPPTTVIITTTTTNLPAITSIPDIETNSKTEIGQFCQQFIGKNAVLAMNGTQFKAGQVSCSSTPMGLIPSVDNMVSTLITAPSYGAILDASVNNTVKLLTNNLDEGFFDDPNTRYYLSPSNLANGIVQGHQHITVEFLGDGLNPPDATKFSFFKGINNAAVDSAKKELLTDIPAGTLKVAGLYRICSMSGSFGHQPILAPIPNRGPADDCIRVTVQL